MSEKKPVKYFRLKDNHPSIEKMNKIFDLMEELNVVFLYDRLRLFFIDQDANIEVKIIECENRDNEISTFELPLVFDCNFLIENPEYKKYTEEVSRLAEIQRIEDKRIEEEKEKERIKLEKEKREREEKEKEIEILKRLSKKHGIKIGEINE